MMKIVLSFLLFIVCKVAVCSQHNFRDDTISTQEFDGHSTGTMLNQTRDAIFSYTFVKDRADILAKEWEWKIFGRYSKQVMLIAPFVTGRIEFNAMDMNFYVNARDQRGGVRYEYNF